MRNFLIFRIIDHRFWWTILFSVLLKSRRLSSIKCVQTIKKGYRTALICPRLFSTLWRLSFHPRQQWECYWWAESNWMYNCLPMTKIMWKWNLNLIFFSRFLHLCNNQQTNMLLLECCLSNLSMLIFYPQIYLYSTQI